MAVSIRKMFVKSKNHGLKCPFSMDPDYITVHNTYNDASANNEVQYMINNTNEVSFHYAVDDKEVVQGIPTNRNAWHCGDGNGTGNRKSIGIEICYSKSGGSRYEKAEKNAIKFIAQLLKEHGWGIDRVKKHQDWSGKYCPHRILDAGEWGKFKDAIEAELKGNKKVEKSESNKGAEAPMSIVDWMKAHDMDHSFNNREKLAKKYGISGYRGTASQNIELLDKLKDADKPKKVERINIITGSYVVGSDGLADLERFLKSRGWNYRKEKATEAWD